MNDNSSPPSRLFRDTTHLIPTPGTQKGRPKRYEPEILNIWIVMAITLIMVGLAVGLEVALYFSHKNYGFPIPLRSSFGFTSTQFLSSFFPTLIVGAVGFSWSITDDLLRMFQPYITLSKGNITAEEGLLLNYVRVSKIRLNEADYVFLSSH
jgi:hypothetical protein